MDLSFNQSYRASTFILLQTYYKLQQISMIEAIDMLLFLNETSLQIEGVDATTNASVL